MKEIVHLYVFFKRSDCENYPALRFRKYLKRRGFGEVSRGTYCRHFARDLVEEEKKRIEEMAPTYSDVDILEVTSRQFSKMKRIRKIIA